MSAVATTEETRSAWQAWEDARWRAVSAPHGIAALAETAWLFAREQTVDGVAGTWRSDGAEVVGAGLSGSGYTDGDGAPVGDEVRLSAGDTLVAGDRLLRAFVRDGAPALRILDPQTPQRVSLTGIDAYEPEAAWAFPARFEASDAPLVVELVDGHRSISERTGVLVFERDGVEIRLTATIGADALSVVFGDETNGDETYRFRFLRVELPDAEGRTTVDFTRAFLPPCAFSAHYVCPLPPPGNRLALRITAGEKLPLHAEA